MNTQNTFVAQRAQALRLLDLPQAWAGRASYTLLDLDDDYGLRFVTLWSQWRSDLKRCARVHVVLVVQALALPGTVYRHLISALPEQDHTLAEQLLKQWPLNLPGVHRLEFDALHVTLTIAVGPVTVMLERLTLVADAVLLSEARLVKPTPGQAGWAVALGRLTRANTVLLARVTTAAWPADFERSFIVHEQAVYRIEGGLDDFEQNAWRPGIIQATAQSALLPSGGRVVAAGAEFVGACSASQYLLRLCVSPRAPACVSAGVPGASTSAPRHLVVVGGGLAGLHVAQALALRGWRITVLEPAAVRGHVPSSHLAAALTPVVSRQDELYARLSRAGSLRAQARWTQMSDAIVTPCGALQLQRASGRIVDLKRIVEGLEFPESFVRFVDAEQASELAGLLLTRGGLYFSTARRVQPQPLLAQLAHTGGITCVSAQAFRVQRATRGVGPWRVLDRTGTVLAEAEQVVLAAGLATQQLLAASNLLEADSRLASMYGLGGELTYVDQALLAGGPRCIVSGDGYVLPAVQGQCVLGGSYLNEGGSAEASARARQDNLARGAQLLNMDLPRGAHAQSPLKGWGGQRAVVPDRFPVVGPLLGSSGLWAATGFASRGLTWASLVGDLIAASLTNEPLPLENDIIARISKN